jgi:hypothetical protein
LEKGTRLISGRYLVVYALLESPLQGSGWLGGNDPDQHPQLLHHQDTQSQLRVVKAFSGNFVEKSAVG